MSGAYLAYNLLLSMLSPAFGVYFAHRIFVSGKSRHAWKQQLGFLGDIPRRTEGRVRIWIQAVSVGEAVASVPVFKALRELLPNAELILSTTTTTGQEVARKSVKEADHVIYFPLDFAPCVLQAISAVKPDVFVSMESEIWPNFLHRARAKGVRTAIVNGIVSDKTARRSRRILWLYRWALGNVDRFCMQSQADKDRVVKLGASAERVSVEGNCKFDEPIPTLDDKQRAELRSKFGIPEGVPVFVAGSTNPGEDEPVAEAFTIARKRHGDLRMILAPRQIERAPEIAAMLVSMGYTVGRRSESDKLTGLEDVVLLDTLGELATVYAIGQAAFVGGSLIKKGGHNILQPIAHGKPVFFGPHTFKCRDLVRIAKDAEVGFEVADGRELGEELAKALSDPAWLGETEQKALVLMAQNRGASMRCAKAVVELLSVGKTG